MYCEELSEPDLTFDKALKLAQGVETASKDVKVLQPLESGHIQKVCRSKGSASTSKAKGGGVQQTSKLVKKKDEVMFTLYKVDEIDISAEDPFVETLTQLMT